MSDRPGMCVLIQSLNLSARGGSQGSAGTITHFQLNALARQELKNRRDGAEGLDRRDSAANFLSTSATDAKILMHEDAVKEIQKASKTIPLLSLGSLRALLRLSCATRALLLNWIAKRPAMSGPKISTLPTTQSAASSHGRRATGVDS